MYAVDERSVAGLGEGRVGGAGQASKLRIVVQNCSNVNFQTRELWREAACHQMHKYMFDYNYALLSMVGILIATLEWQMSSVLRRT
jgi:hypothetical protein